MTGADGRVQASFEVPAHGYDLLIGRYLPTLAPAFADFAGVSAGRRALDIGCGPGGLTTELVRRLGADQVGAIDPSAPFADACRVRNRGVDVRVGVAEHLPFDDRSFDVSLACLVVGFMTDAVAGVREMVRVTTSGGTVAVCFWNYPEMPTLDAFFSAAATIDPAQAAERSRLGTSAGELPALLQQAGGLVDIEQSTITATARYTDFDDWWSPFPLGVGPPGAFHQSLTSAQQTVLRDRCFELLGRPSGGFSLTAQAWAARGNKPRGPGG